MANKFLRLLPVLALAAMAQASDIPTATVTFIGATNNVVDGGGDYVTPYEITVDTGSGPMVQLVTCYDQIDNVSPNDPPWQANLLTIADIIADPAAAYFSNDLAGYEEVAWLSAQTYSSPDQEIALQHAIWEVFDPPPSYNPNPQDQAQTDDLVAYQNAAATAASGGYANFSFNSFVFLEEVGGSPDSTPPSEQAFVYQTSVTTTGNSFSTPEPGTLMMFGGGVICLLTSRGLRRLKSKSSRRDS